MDHLAEEIRRAARIAESGPDDPAGDAPPEPQQDPRVADRLMLRLLEQLREHGPLNQDQFVRHCLRPDELASVLPDKERIANAERTVEAMIAYLSPPEQNKPYDAAVQQWIQSLERVRWMLQWPMLPPRVAKRVRNRADFLRDNAREHGWIKPADDNPDHIELTLTGQATIEPLQQRLVRVEQD